MTEIIVRAVTVETDTVSPDDYFIDVEFDEDANFSWNYEATEGCWRLTGCQDGCRACAHLHPLWRDDPELAADLLVPSTDCDRDWWLYVVEGATTSVKASEPAGRHLEITALPWTDFEC